MQDKVSRFDPTIPMNALRMMCGLFFVPHILFKINGYAGSIGFFTKAGLVPAELFYWLAIVVETVSCVGLVLGVLTPFIAAAAAGALAVAAYAVFATKGVGWLWNLGGVEYIAFWGASCLLVAWNQRDEAWKILARLRGGK